MLVGSSDHVQRCREVQGMGMEGMVGMVGKTDSKRINSLMTSLEPPSHYCSVFVRGTILSC